MSGTFRLMMLFPSYVLSFCAFNKLAGLQIGFKLKESGMMKKFEGTWQIQPFNQDTLDQNFGFDSQQKQHWISGPMRSIRGLHKSEALLCSKTSQCHRLRYRSVTHSSFHVLDQLVKRSDYVDI